MTSPPPPGSSPSAERGLPVAVYVPRPGTPARAAVVEQAGVVGTPTEEGRVVLDYEANLHEAVNIKTYADAVHHAADRHLWGAEGYPTRARTEVGGEDVVEVGHYDGERVVVHPDTLDLLAEWLGIERDRVEAECQRSE